MKAWLFGAAALGGLCVAGLGAAEAAEAPSTVEELVVTAQKRSERLQDVPIAITALGAKQLKDQHVSNILDLNGLSPSLSIKTDDNAANPKIFIRGVGLNDFNPNTAAPVAIYVDGVYIGSPLAQMGQFFDLERIEVLRGPQGTLYGRNTTGGAVNVVSRRPTQAFTADASAEYGRFNAIALEGGVGGPLVKDVLAFRVAGAGNWDDGYTLNRLTGHHGNDQNRWALRGSLLYTPSADLEVLAQAHYAKSQGSSILAYNRPLFPATAAATGPDGFCAPGFYTSGQCTDAIGYANTSSDLYEGDYHLEGKDRVRTYGGSVSATWKLGAVDLVSVTGYEHAKRNDLEDTDAGPNDVITADYRARQSAISEELRLQSAGTGPAKWVLGGYVSRDHLTTDSYYDILRLLRDPTPANPTGADLENSVGVFGWPYKQTNKSYAVFGQVDYSVTDALILTGGLRYSADRKSFDYASTAEFGAITFFTVDDRKTFDSLSGKVGVQYRFSPDANIYATYNRGYKSGGFFGGQTVDPSTLGPYKDEKVDAYEAGAKFQAFDRRLTGSISAFYYDYQDLQVYDLVLQGNITVQVFTNASNARIYGGEAELTARPIDGLTLQTGISLLDATYRDYVTAGGDYSGNRLPNAPKFSGTALAQYEWPVAGGSMRVAADATFRSKVFFDTRNLERLSDKGRAFVNARLGWTSPDESYELGIWGRNIFDETNISDIIPIEGLGFDLFSMGRPRTYGVYARFHY
ncbi:MAG: TonB-dependent receptor [Phenylobacterium sp.]|uniref:TonB-dependent receptor n=1 Tax=Phenylobacterium sp. TaxID=1871053 RepID=UPI0025F00DB1|nr:TonB-dependent receptor [Phenylobacterium sp.]MBI1199765.1 TonB-dependent receptor [Phenylobacterium sp.]